jgi:peptide/nickel transport system substrate-binding protein
MKNNPSVIRCIVLLALLLASCAPPATETPAATQAPAATESQAAAPTATAAPTVEPTAEPSAVDEKLGGVFRYAIYGDPDTLDPHKTTIITANWVLQFIGASLVTLNGEGRVVPWLAESWEVSDDGLVYTFHLRDDVTFTDGTPFTAEDCVWTIQRELDPEVSPRRVGVFGSLKPDGVVAVDDYTLQLTLSQPFFPLLYALADNTYQMMMSRDAYEAMGDQEFGKAPVSAGPYTVKEWNLGRNIILERNPDYAWGPEIPGIENTGAWHIETIEILFIPEYATILAGMEAGEIDYSQVQAKDMQLLLDTGQFDSLEVLQQGLRPFFLFNVQTPLFQDVRVRKAFNLAINRDTFVQVLVRGAGQSQFGPLSPSQIGYWPGVEDIGYGFDLEQAKALMQEAGYTYDAEGMLLTPEGEPFKLKIYTLPIEVWVKTTELAVEMYRQLGVDMEIVQEDPGLLIQRLTTGDYEFSILGVTALEADILYGFHSSMIGAGNFSHLSDPELDRLLDRSRAEIDPAARQQVLNDIQKLMVEQAYIVPVYIPINYSAINNRVKDYHWFPQTLFYLYMADAYIDE